MGIREWINENRKVLSIVIGALIVLLIVYRFMLGGEDADDGDNGPALAFFSNDDGAKWFPDDAKKLPPFSKDGKDAVRVYVFKCPDGKEFAAWLERYTPQSKQKLEAMQAEKDKAKDLFPMDAVEVEIKVPGQPIWMKKSDPRAAAIMTPKCPKGGDVEMVGPKND